MLRDKGQGVNIEGANIKFRIIIHLLNPCSYREKTASFLATITRECYTVTFDLNLLVNKGTLNGLNKHFLCLFIILGKCFLGLTVPQLEKSELEADSNYPTKNIEAAVAKASSTLKNLLRRNADRKRKKRSADVGDFNESICGVISHEFRPRVARQTVEVTSLKIKKNIYPQDMHVTF